MKTMKSLAIAMFLGIFWVALANANPTTGEPILNVKTETGKTVKLQINNLFGQPATLVLKDEQGTTLFAESIENSQSYATLLNLANLPTGDYVMSLEVNNRSLKQPLTVGSQTIEVDATALTTLVKPVFQVKNKSVKILLEASKASDIKVLIMDDQLNRIFKESEGNVLQFGKQYDLSAFPKGDYLVKVTVNGEEYVEILTIE